MVPTKEAAHDKPGFAAVPTNVADSFSLEHDSDGELVAVAFTDEEALHNWNKSIPWIALQGTAFFQAVASTEAIEIVINPYEPENPDSKMIRPGGRVTRWEFEELAEGRIPQEDSNEQEAEPQSVLVTMPKQMPTPMKCSMRLAKWLEVFLRLRACISGRSSIRMEDRTGQLQLNSPQIHQPNWSNTSWPLWWK